MPKCKEQVGEILKELRALRLSNQSERDSQLGLPKSSAFAAVTAVATGASKFSETLIKDRRESALRRFRDTVATGNVVARDQAMSRFTDTRYREIGAFQKPIGNKTWPEIRHQARRSTLSIERLSSLESSARRAKKGAAFLTLLQVAYLALDGTWGQN
jgi:hypothetical protein